MKDLITAIVLDDHGEAVTRQKIIETNNIVNEIHQILRHERVISIIGEWNHIRSQGGNLCLPEEGVCQQQT